jgi:hypothetical protein
MAITPMRLAIAISPDSHVYVGTNQTVIATIDNPIGSISDMLGNNLHVVQASENHRPTLSNGDIPFDDVSS